jgi:hypothetical protein
VLRYLVDAAKRDGPVKRTLDRRAAYLDAYAPGRRALYRWDGFYEWNKKTRVVHLGARDLRYQRQPTLIYEQMVFAAELTAIGRIAARMLPTPRRRHAGSVNASSIPHDLVVLAQPSKDCLVDSLPNASFHPFM